MSQVRVRTFLQRELPWSTPYKGLYGEALNQTKPKQTLFLSRHIVHNVRSVARFEQVFVQSTCKCTHQAV